MGHLNLNRKEGTSQRNDRIWARVGRYWKEEASDNYKKQGMIEYLMNQKEPDR